MANKKASGGANGTLRTDRADASDCSKKPPCADGFLRVPGYLENRWVRR